MLVYIKSILFSQSLQHFSTKALILDIVIIDVPQCKANPIITVKHDYNGYR